MMEIAKDATPEEVAAHMEYRWETFEGKVREIVDNPAAASAILMSARFLSLPPTEEFIAAYRSYRDR